MNALFLRSLRPCIFSFKPFRSKGMAFPKPESIIWLGSLLWLGLFANLEQQRWSLCPLHALGLDFCPGCGLGRSIGMAMRGQFAASWAMHPLGIPSFLILLHRVVVLSFPGLSGLPQKLKTRLFNSFAKFARHERR